MRVRTISESVIGSSGIAAGASSSLAAEGLLVKHVFSKAWSNTLQVGDVVGQLLDGLDLLLQVVPFDEISQL